MTPTPAGVGPGGLPPGFMSVKFNVATAFNFSSNSYLIVFNTSNPSATNEVTPVAEAVQTGFAGYSLAIAVGGTNGAITAQAFSYYRPTSSSQTPVLYNINPTAQQLQLNVNTNGLGNQFTVIFSRIIANFNVNATPTPNASASASPTPSAGPTAVPSGVPVTQYWTYNFFTVTGTIQQLESAQQVVIVDSLGANGPTDSSFNVTPALNVDTDFDVTFYTQAGGGHPSTPDAIAGGEIANAKDVSATASPSSSPSTSPTASAS